METATTRWIEDGVAGGFVYRCLPGDGMECEYNSCNSEWAVFTRKDNHSSICPTIEELVLRPDFWQAVGKTRYKEMGEKWPNIPPSLSADEFATKYARLKMHKFVENILDGYDINTALEGIE